VIAAVGSLADVALNTITVQETIKDRRTVWSRAS
jgi:hypothetical protein